MRSIKKLLLATFLAGAMAPAFAAVGCQGKMWNPLADIDFRNMGSLKIAGFTLMDAPGDLGNPPGSSPDPGCFCRDGLDTGFGFTTTFWLPSKIIDVTKKSGSMPFMNCVAPLPAFVGLSSAQTYNRHEARKDESVSMQIHMANADITAIAGKALFEKCGAAVSKFSIAYMTELDFLWQNDVYATLMSPQVSILAAAPILSQVACGAQSIANSLGDWQNWNFCAWEGSLYPLNGSTIAKNSAQVSNMDIIIKYLSRSAIMGTNLRTMGNDAICEPKFDPIYNPFQNRFQWSFPHKVTARYNQSMVRWGLNPGPLNFPTHEEGYMHLWEARQCCLKVLTVNSLFKAAAGDFLSESEQYKQYYEYYQTANQIYETVQNPLGGALGYVGDSIAAGLSSAGGGILESVKPGASETGSSASSVLSANAGPFVKQGSPV